METTSTLPVVAESGADQAVGHVGLHALGDFADRLSPGVRSAIAGGFAEVRWDVWRRTTATKGKGPIYLDIDATLIRIHSENKEMTGPN
jgi:hypothetical protein